MIKNMKAILYTFLLLLTQCKAVERREQKSVYLLFDDQLPNRTFLRKDLTAEENSTILLNRVEKHFMIVCNKFTYDLRTKDMNKFHDVPFSQLKRVKECRDLSESEAENFDFNSRLFKRERDLYSLFIAEKHENFFRIYEVWPSNFYNEHMRIEDDKPDKKN